MWTNTPRVLPSSLAIHAVVGVVIINTSCAAQLGVMHRSKVNLVYGGKERPTLDTSAQVVESAFCAY